MTMGSQLQLLALSFWLVAQTSDASARPNSHCQTGLRRLIEDCNGCTRQPSASGVLKSALLQHSRRHQLFLQMSLQNLDEKLAQVRAVPRRARHSNEAFNRGTEHLRRRLSRFDRNFR